MRTWEKWAIPTYKAAPLPAPSLVPVLALWAVATTAGLFLDHLFFQYVLNDQLAGALNGGQPNALSLALFLILMAESLGQGLLVGGAQWVVLSRFVRRAEWWIVASILGWAIFFCVDFAYLGLAQHSAAVTQTVSGLGKLGELLAFELVTGLVVGLVQWTILRAWGRAALLWVLIVILAQLVGVLVVRLPLPAQAAPLLSWFTEGLITGLGIAFLLNRCWPTLLERGQVVG